MKGFAKDNLIILLVILILFLYLGIKAFDKNGWDGWGFGSAQTLMSSQYWARDGFAKNYFLFIPSPYSKLIPYLDKPEFRNRAIDDSGGALKRNRIYYTHYPPLYLVPYALMTKIQIENRAAFRMFSILISLAALFIFYLFIKSISSKTLAIVSSVYYGFSITFLNYADSASTQPQTILFTFLILYLSVLSARNFENLKIYNRYNLFIWISYLALSLSSFDATIFIFAWLVLYDVVVIKKLFWSKWLLWALAPILGFSLQVFQNTWYLGRSDAIKDIYASYAGRAIGSPKNFILGLVAPFVSMASVKTVFIFKKTVITLASIAAIFSILWKFREKFGLNSKYFKVLFILAFAAAAQPFFINVTGLWPYQGVLTAPFWGLLIGVASIGLLQYVAVLKHSKERMWFIVLFLIVSGLWFARFYDTFEYVKNWPNNRPDQKVIEFSKTIQAIEPGKEKMAFRIIPQNSIWKSQFPVFNFEYYLGMPKIDFANTKDLLVDFWWLRGVSEHPFYSFIISENKSDVLKIRQEISSKNIKDISPVKEIQDQYIFIVGPK